MKSQPIQYPCKIISRTNFNFFTSYEI